MKIIVLSGKSNSGKSSSLKYCFIKMLENKEFVFIWKSRGFSSDRKSVIKDIKNNWYQSNGRDACDISGVFKYNGKTIFIVTIGDSIDDIRNQLRNCDSKYGPIDLFLCSRHDNNNIRQELSNVGIEITDVIPIGKGRASNVSIYDKENKETGEQLYNEIINQLK